MNFMTTREKARDFDDGYWLTLIHEGSNKMRIEYCEDRNGSVCYLRAVQGHPGGIPLTPESMNYTLILCKKFRKQKRMTGPDNQCFSKTVL